jgi:CRP-like cAMP-binding protein
MRSFIDRQVVPRIEEAIPLISLFRGMNQEQVRRVAGRCSLRVFQEGEVIIEEGRIGDTTYIVLDGEASVTTVSGHTEVGKVLPGECLGEISLLTKSNHSATARARTRLEMAVLPHEELIRLIHLRPDIGVIVYRNLATGLGKKLIRSGHRD